MLVAGFGFHRSSLSDPSTHCAVALLKVVGVVGALEASKRQLEYALASLSSADAYEGRLLDTRLLASYVQSAAPVRALAMQDRLAPMAADAVIAGLAAGCRQVVESQSERLRLARSAAPAAAAFGLAALPPALQPMATAVPAGRPAPLPPALPAAAPAGQQAQVRRRRPTGCCPAGSRPAAGGAARAARAAGCPSAVSLATSTRHAGSTPCGTASVADWHICAAGARHWRRTDSSIDAVLIGLPGHSAGRPAALPHMQRY